MSLNTVFGKCLAKTKKKLNKWYCIYLQREKKKNVNLLVYTPDFQLCFKHNICIIKSGYIRINVYLR